MTDDNLDENLPCHETLSDRCFVSLLGWPVDDEEEARHFGSSLLGYAKGISCYFDLSRLERIIVAHDYEEGLQAVAMDAGRSPVARTVNEYGQGRAMAVHVVRDNDELCSIVVIWTPLVVQLLDEKHPDHGLALQILLHELGHVHDLRIFAKTFPGGWRSALTYDGREQELQSIVNPCQSEYLAQYRAAWACPEQGLSIIDMLSSALQDVEGQIRRARRDYRTDGDIDRFWNIVAERMRFLFYSIGITLGHADWILDTNSRPDLVEVYRQRLIIIQEHPLGWLIDACRLAVEPFKNIAEWTGIDMYDPLIVVAESALKNFGIELRSENGSLHIDVPLHGAIGYDDQINILKQMLINRRDQ